MPRGAMNSFLFFGMPLRELGSNSQMSLSFTTTLTAQGWAYLHP